MGNGQGVGFLCNFRPESGNFGRTPCGSLTDHMWKEVDTVLDHYNSTFTRFSFYGFPT